MPQSSKADRINAARRVVQRCKFSRERCYDGLEALKQWRFKWDEDRKEFSKEPEHDWASHPGDGFSYGAQVMEELSPPSPKTANERRIIVGANEVTMDDMWAMLPETNVRI